MFSSISLLGALAGTAMAGTVLWNGNPNATEESTVLNDWSFSNEVGAYQYYIHGTGPVTDYVNFSPSFKNPADTGAAEGIKITLDNSSVWNNDGMLRTELIPQTTAPINKGKVFYHFSMQHTSVNTPSQFEEHQVCFFESHFTEMKYGLIDGEQGVTSDNHLRWEVNSVSQWNTTFTAGEWHNIAYAIDFDANTVGFYHSTDADDLALVVAPVSVTTSSNGADWHLGVLRLPSTTGRTDTAAEDWYFSGVYIESDTLTTKIGSGAAASSVAPTTVAPASTSSVVVASAAPSSATSITVVTPLGPSTASSVVPSTTSTVVASVPSTSSSSTTIKPSTTFATSVKSSAVSSAVSSAMSSSTVAPVQTSSLSTTVLLSTAIVVPVPTSLASSLASSAASTLSSVAASTLPSSAVSAASTLSSAVSAVSAATSTEMASSMPAKSSPATSSSTNAIISSALAVSTTAVPTSVVPASVISSSSEAVAATTSAATTSAPAGGDDGCVIEYVYA